MCDLNLLSGSWKLTVSELEIDAYIIRCYVLFCFHLSKIYSCFNFYGLFIIFSVKVILLCLLILNESVSYLF